MPFRTTELSNPDFDPRGLRFITVKSNHLHGRGDLTVYVPEGLEEHTDLPIIILLHGVYGSHWAWAGYTQVHLIVQGLITAGKIPPIMLAMPSDGLWGDGSGYLPHAARNFEAWIVEEVPMAVRELIPQAANSQDLCIAGLSMGGYGALRLGSKYPHLFRAFSGLSSITDRSQLAAFLPQEEFEQFQQIGQADESVFRYMQENRDMLPPFRFDCGVDDPLIAYNRDLHTALVEYHIPHQYEEYPGGHSWEYWAKHIEKTLLFFGKQLTRSRHS